MTDPDDDTTPYAFANEPLPFEPPPPPPPVPTRAVVRTKPIPGAVLPPTPAPTPRPRPTRAKPAKAIGNPFRTPLRLMLAGYLPFLAAVCVVGGCVAAGLIALGAGGWGVLSLLALGLGLVVAGGVVQVLWGLRVLGSKPPRVDPMEVDLPRRWQAGLAALVREVAGDRGLPEPDVIRLHATSVAHVYEDDDGNNVLVVGGPAIAAFSRDALAGVIAHELAHFDHGDTALSRSAAARHRVMGELESQFFASEWAWWNPLAWLVRGYHAVYARLLFADSRRAEYAADRHEVAHVGADEAAATLVRLTVLNFMPWTNLDNVAEWFVGMNQRLDRLFAEQVRRLRAAGPSEWEDAMKKALRRPAEWTDTHPALPDRLAAIGVKPRHALPLAADLRGEPATGLFDNWPVVEGLLTERVMAVVRARDAAKTEFLELAAALVRAGRDGATRAGS